MSIFSDTKDKVESKVNGSSYIKTMSEPERADTTMPDETDSPNQPEEK